MSKTPITAALLGASLIAGTLVAGATTASAGGSQRDPRPRRLGDIDHLEQVAAQVAQGVAAQAIVSAQLQHHQGWFVLLQQVR